jgi:superfamily II DNA or RNA helicase
MRMDSRAEAVNEFMDKADENIMLVSLKAGNAGLNLSKASQVIMLDPFWNPFVEEQAVDRAHRMPQKREGTSRTWEWSATDLSMSNADMPLQQIILSTVHSY